MTPKVALAAERGKRYGLAGWPIKAGHEDTASMQSKMVCFVLPGSRPANKNWCESLSFSLH
jgi:hypothetical protein